MITAHQTKQKVTSAVRKENGVPFFQAKLSINQPNDVYEQEAVAVADKVMRMSDESGQKQTFFKPVISTLQRKCKDCEEEEKLRRKENSSQATEAESDVSSYISSLSSKGSPLPDDTRRFFEPKFGHDFSEVKIHTDVEAVKSSQSINALAYTTSNHIVFNQNQFSPNSDSGKKLLAHELTHVVQQTKSITNIQRQPQTDPPWLNPDYKGDLPGERVPGLGPFTKDELRKALIERNKENKENLASFLGVYTKNSIEILGTYLTSEMSAEAKKALHSKFGIFLQFALGQTLQIIASGTVGIFAYPLSKGAVAALKVLAEWSTGTAASEVMASSDSDAASDNIGKKQKILDKITVEFAKDIGSITEKMILKLGGGEGVSENLATWLERANMKELERFRIPALFPKVNPDAIKSVITGMIAGLAHAQYQCEPGWGLQCGNPLGPNEDFTSGSVQLYDDNIIIIDTQKAKVKNVEFYSNSPILYHNIVNKAKISLLPSVPLFIVVHPVSETEELKTAQTIMDGATHNNTMPGDATALLSAYPNAHSQMLIKRDEKGKVSVLRGGLDLNAWLYILNNNSSLYDIGKYIGEWQEGEDLNLPKNPGAQPAFKGSELISPEKVAAKAYMEFSVYLVDGANKFLEQKLLNLTPQNSEDRFDNSYWLKNNRNEFWEMPGKPG